MNMRWLVPAYLFGLIHYSAIADTHKNHQANVIDDIFKQNNVNSNAFVINDTPIKHNIFSNNDPQNNEQVLQANQLHNKPARHEPLKIFVNEHATYSEVFNDKKPIYFDNVAAIPQKIFKNTQPSYSYDGIFLDVYSEERPPPLPSSASSLQLTATIEDVKSHLFYDQPKARLEPTESIRSIASDVGINLSYQHVLQTSASIDSKIRFGRSILSGISTIYHQKMFELLYDEWRYQYEGKKRSYFLGNIQPPTT